MTLMSTYCTIISTDPMVLMHATYLSRNQTVEMGVHVFKQLFSFKHTQGHYTHHHFLTGESMAAWVLVLATHVFWQHTTNTRELRYSRILTVLCLCSYCI